MIKYLITPLTVMVLCSQALAYDELLAKRYAEFFSTFDEENVSQALRQIPASTVVEMIKQDEELVIVDVRTSKEQSMLAITYPHTLNIPMNEVFQPENLKRIPTDKKVILTCKAGLRRTIMTLALHHVGFNNVYSMKGGITEMNKYLGAKTAFSSPPKKP